MKAAKASRGFWSVAIACAFLACINYASEDNNVFDVNIHDTYYVIAHSHLYTGLIILYFSLGLIYRLSKNLALNRTLTAIHTIVTVGGFTAYFMLWAITNAIHDPKNLLDSSMDILNAGIMIIFLLAVLIQPLLPVNLIIGFLKNRKNH